MPGGEKKKKPARKGKAKVAKKVKAKKPKATARNAKPKKAAAKRAKAKKPKPRKPAKRAGKRTPKKKPRAKPKPKFNALERKAINVAKLIRMKANAIIATSPEAEKLLKAARYVRTETPAGIIYYRADIAKRRK